jgi:pyridoxal phosphate enzyme (YggS family)
MIATNLQRVQAEIAAACRAAGRDPASVTLVAVSKTRPPDDLRAAHAAGQVHFGENYAQELRDKADALGPAYHWHYIGALQRNKVKYVVGRAELVHDVDSLALAEEIGKRSLPRVTGVLIGVNMGGEASMSGVATAVALALAHAMTRIDGIALRGLMCIPPADGDPTPHFTALADLAARGRAEGLPLTELSMGMSGDFAAAIRCGATIVRVGTAIFGGRG